MARVNVYLQDDLHEEIQRLGVETSRVCQDALRKEVQKMNALAEAGSDIEAVADRLKETQAEEDRHSWEEGHDLGVQWAKKSATLPELREMAAARSGKWPSLSVSTDHTLQPWLHELWAVDHGLSIPPNHEFDLAWGRPFDTGLIEGALEVLEQALPHL